MSSAASVPAEGVRDRKAAKGRRRRAAAEQRRIEQQRWGKYLDEEEDDYPAVAPVARGSRRRARRRSDRESMHDYFDHAQEEEFDPDLALSLALALSLSSTAIEDAPAATVPIGTLPVADMSYESLVQLESVTCVASASVIASLPVCSFVKELVDVSDVCVICQGEYDHGDSQLKLPCLHGFHQACGSEWLRKYSKLCPVCKHDVTETASEVIEALEASE